MSCGLWRITTNRSRTWLGKKPRRSNDTASNCNRRPSPFPCVEGRSSLDSVAVHAVEPATRAPDPQAERLAGLALLPVLTTGLYYALPPRLQDQPAILFLPQVLAYLGLAIWATQNSFITERLGLKLHQLRQGLRWGTVTGLILGLLNVSVILW